MRLLLLIISCIPIAIFRHLWILLIPLYSVSVQAQECRLRLENIIDVEIMVTTTSNSTQHKIVQNKRNEKIKVSNSGGDCEFFISFTGASSIRYLESARSKVAYGLYDSVQRSNPLIGIPIATEKNLLVGEFKSQQKMQTFTYFYLLETNDAISADEYTDTVQVELYAGTPDNYILQDTRTITFTMKIDPFINVTVQGGQGAGKKTTLNFGIARPGISLGFNVNANTGYDIRLESENRGVMRLDTYLVPNTIPYLLFQDGNRLDLSNAVKLPYTNSNYSRAVERYDFIVYIGEYEYVLSGSYEDTITVTVMAR